VSPRTNRQQQAEETRNRLIDSALRVFSTKGFAASTTKDIAKEAGVTDGLIYHYFSSKEDLIWAILERHTLIHQIQQMMARFQPEMDVEAIVSTYIRNLFEMLEQNNDLIVMIFGEAQRNEEIRARLSRIVNDGAKPLAAILARKVNLEEAELHHAVRNLQFAVLQYYLILYRSLQDTEDRDQYIQRTVRQFMRIMQG